MKLFVIIGLLLGMTYCVKSQAEPTSFEDRVQESIVNACEAKWGSSTPEEIHSTASCVCSINAGLNLGVYQLVRLEGGTHIAIEKAPEEGPSVYASEDDFIDEFLDTSSLYDSF